MKIINPINFELIYYKPTVRRRISWLKHESKSNDGEKDLAVTSIMRTLSNNFTVGESSPSSAAVKMRNKIISKRAHDFILNCNKISWTKDTINEHPEPLNETWRWICSTDNIDEEEIALRFFNFPMVTVTKEEDELLSSLNFRSKGTPAERYAATGIEIICLDEMPYEIFKKR